MSDYRALPLPPTPMPRRRFLHTLGVAGGAALLSAVGLPAWARAAKKGIRFLHMEVMLSFMNTDKTHVGSIQLEGPGPSPNQGRIWASDVIPRMYQNALTKKMSPSEAVDACAQGIRGFTEKGKPSW